MEYSNDGRGNPAMVRIVNNRMLSGMELMASVDERLRRAETTAAAAQADLDWLIARRDRARSAEASSLRALAQLRLGMLKAGSNELQRLDEADAQAQALLAKQAADVAAAEADLETHEATLQTAEAERDQHAEAIRKLDTESERALAVARERVLGDPQWQAKQEAAEAAGRVAEHAEQKAAFAVQDSEVKGKPYLADPLFAYLLRRGFGTPQYRAGFFVRFMDRWVARVARFEPARRNYAALTDLPGQLSAHAVRMRAAAGAAAAHVGDYARQIAGLPTTQEVATLRQSLEASEAKVETAQAAVDAAASRRAELTAGEDPHTRGAMQALESALGQASLQELRAAASRTPTLEDDAMVAELEQAHGARVQAEGQLGQRRQEVEIAQDELRKLREIRQGMRQQGYAQHRWNMSDGALVGLLLSEVMRGTLSRGGFLERLNQRRIPDPWNSAPGDYELNGGWGEQAPWGLPPSSSPWRLPGSGRGGFGGGFGGSFGGGGFGTGGSIGGGGFGTGGSF
jgi:hypothetical protein